MKGKHMAETTRKSAAKPAAEKAATVKSKAGKAAKPAAEPKVVASKPTATKAEPAKKAKAVAASAATTTTPVKRAPRKPSSKISGQNTGPTISDEQRYLMIAEAAYYRAESSQFQSDPVRDWIEAEKDIAALLNGQR